MKGLIHVVLTAISMTLAILIFLISHERLWIEELKSWGIKDLLKFRLFETLDNDFVRLIFPYAVYLLFLGVIIGITWGSIRFISKKLDKIPYFKDQIILFEHANDFYLPIYLGYSFVAISLPTFKSFILFFILMLLLLCRTRFFYFNPLFLILGYKFYFLVNNDKSKILLITKKEIKKLDDIFDPS
ncbi:hypothetical protein, partial [Acinetobacter baumannii]|uniref:hypothetical protein n=1 Tax=Acinetobacter baumannii TaxID=470 RepID=UPI002447AFAC